MKERPLSKLSIPGLLKDIEAVHRDLAHMTIAQLRGESWASKSEDVVASRPLPSKPKTVRNIKRAIREAGDETARELLHRTLFGCTDLAVYSKTASLSDMLKFYMERGRMHVDDSRIPALDVVPWLQAERDFDRREQMRREMTIFLKAIVNPLLLATLEVTVKTVTLDLDFGSYLDYSEARKGFSFAEKAASLEQYLADTGDLYNSLIIPWVEEKIGRPMENLSRYHALHLVRITRFDDYFEARRLPELLNKTFSGLGFEPFRREDLFMDLGSEISKNPDGLCVGVEIPGNVHVLMRPVGGLIDVETALHETGHAFLLCHVDPDLPVEFRRLYRSTALDEAFAFLFMGLIENQLWLEDVAGLPQDKARELRRLAGTKRLCMIRRYIGKFLAERELHESRNIKNSEPYCRRLGAATGFSYEPEGYLIDMEPDFYSVDYLDGWAGANTLARHLEGEYGQNWFAKQEAGDLLRSIASHGRRFPVNQAITRACGQAPRLPDKA